MNANTIKNWYNGLFFEDQMPKGATVAITISGEGQSLHIPAINVFADSTIDALVKAWYAYVQENPTAAVMNVPVPPTPELPEPEIIENLLVNVDQVEFREKQYLVEVYADESVVVKNKDTGVVLNPNSPNAKAIAKLAQ